MASWCLALTQVQRQWGGWRAKNNYRFLNHQAPPDTSAHRKNCSLWRINGEAEQLSGSLFLRSITPQGGGLLPSPWALMSCWSRVPFFSSKDCLALSCTAMGFSFGGVSCAFCFFFKPHSQPRSGSLL